jgi:hypothetical protein
VGDTTILTASGKGPVPPRIRGRTRPARLRDRSLIGPALERGLARTPSGCHGSKERIQLFISADKAQLGRLAHHYGYTITKVVEDLVKDAERAILARLPRRQHAAYLDSHQQRMPAGSKAKSEKSRPACDWHRGAKVTV